MAAGPKCHGAPIHFAIILWDGTDMGCYDGWSATQAAQLWVFFLSVSYNALLRLLTVHTRLRYERSANRSDPTSHIS